MAGVVKVGPWGGRGGKPCDISRCSQPKRLEQITVWSLECPGGRIYSMSFVYVDQKGEPIPVGPWGTNAGCPNKIDLATEEQVHHVSGTADNSGVTSLSFKTNQSEYGPFGSASGTAFSVPLQENQGQVVSFFGCSGQTLVALGVYVPGNRSCPVKLGPWGASDDGTPRDISTDRPQQLENITVRSSEGGGGRVYGLSFTYINHSGQSIHVGPWGSRNKGVPHEITMEDDEYVNLITGTTDSYGVTSLKFNSNKCTYGPYGCTNGTKFSVPLQQGNAAALAFFGCFARDSVLALGTYVAPRA